MKLTEIGKKTKLDEAIDTIMEEMSYHRSDSEEYKEMLDSLERLHELKGKKPKSVSPDAIVGVAGNLLGIGLILSYERIHVITTKALGFVIKGRV